MNRNHPEAPVVDALLEDRPEEDLTPEQLAAKWEAEAPPPAGPLTNAVASVIVVVLGAVAALISLRLGLGAPEDPAAGTWPFLLSLVTVVLGLVQLVLGRRGGAGERFTGRSLMAVAGFATFIGLVALMPVIGFELPSLVLCVIWMKFLGGESWRAALLYSALVVVAFYIIFILALGTSIPHLF